MKAKPIFKALSVFAISVALGVASLFIPTRAVEAESSSTVASDTIITASSGAEVSTQQTYTTAASVEHSGIRVKATAPAEGAEVARFNGVFTENASFSYAIDKVYYTGGGFAFEICDTDGNEIITLVEASQGQYNMYPCAYYNGTYSHPYWINYNAKNMGVKETTETPTLNVTFDPFPLSSQKTVGEWQFNLDEDSFSIKGTSNDLKVLTPVADFTLSAEDLASLQNGFIIKLRALDSSKASDIILGTAPSYEVNCIFTELNGVSLGGETIAVTAGTELGSISYEGEKVVKTLRLYIDLYWTMSIVRVTVMGLRVIGL